MSNLLFFCLFIYVFYIMKYKSDFFSATIILIKYLFLFSKLHIHYHITYEFHTFSIMFITYSVFYILIIFKMLIAFEMKVSIIF